MIKKNTKVIFADEDGVKVSDMIGGIPLSIGEIINVHEGDTIQRYKVADKIVDCFLDGDDQSVNISYSVKKMEK
jgi:hypothetical protein